MSIEKQFLFGDEIHDHPNIYEKMNKDLNTEEPKTEPEPKKYYALYYEANKEQLREKAKAKVSCPLCDRIISKASLNSHLKTNLCTKGQGIKVKKIIMGKLIVGVENNYNNIYFNI